MASTSETLAHRLERARLTFDVDLAKGGRYIAVVLALKDTNLVDRIGKTSCDWSGGASAYMSAVDVDEKWRRKGGALLMVHTLVGFLRSKGVGELRMLCEGSGTVQICTMLVGRENCIYSVAGVDIDYEEAVHIMDVRFGYTRLNMNLRGSCDVL